MKCSYIIEEIEKLYPTQCAESWDNPGLIVGDRNSDVKDILVALDATDEVIDIAVKQKVQLLITHHPMLFHPIKQINTDSYDGRRVLKLISNKISCYAMHTNFDIRKMAQLNEEQILLKNTSVLYQTGECDGKAEGIGRVGELEYPMTYSQLADFVKKSLDIDSVRCYGTLEDDVIIERAAISGGSGKSVVEDALRAGVQVLITGDIDYHTGIDAFAQGLRIIDAGHFGTEKIFIKYMTDELKMLFHECNIYSAPQSRPFESV